MMTEWKTTRLGNFVTLQRGYDLPTDHRNEGNIPVIGSAGLTGWHNEAKLNGPGVTIGRSGASIGYVHYCATDFWPHNACLFVKDFHGNDIKFVYYFLKAMDFNNYNSGSAQPSLNRNIIYEILVSIPPLDIQRKIADILSAYDDLIENNTRRIQDLERAAQSLYREWFVEFRFPGYEAVPMVESELGMIPQGWEVAPVGELLEYHIGGGWGQSEPSGKETEPAFVIRGTDIPDVRYQNIDDCPLRFHKHSQLKTRCLTTGDIVFEVSGGSKDQPVGRSLLIHSKLLDSFSSPVICASFCKLMRVNQQVLIPEILYFHLLRIYENREIMQYQVQSTGITNFKFAHFLINELILIPSSISQEDFFNLIMPMMDEIQVLGVQNQKLREARDILLPRLVSGELDVSTLDIQHMMDEMQMLSR